MYRKVGKSSRHPKQVPQTSKNTKKTDSTVLLSDDLDKEKKTQDLATENSNEHNEFIDSDLNKPKVIITFRNVYPMMRIRYTGKILSRIIPNSERMFHPFNSTKDIIQAAENEGYKYLMILVEESDPYGLIIVELPARTATDFYINSVTFPKKSQLKDFSNIRPEVNISNFITKSDEVLARMLGALFQQDAEYKSKRVVAIHKRRDTVIFRNYKCEILNDKPFIRDLGPKLILQPVL
ncbi:uncharacterized protein LOC111027705 isoform X2 [Myzus persicae]|nr:uncharacterized protein LOC111027705 isoform X2 [Myzus persicae]